MSAVRVSRIRRPAHHGFICRQRAQYPLNAKLNSALNTGKLYTDTTVANGNNYCYATTAVDSSAESTYSNIISNVQIPLL